MVQGKKPKKEDHITPPLKLPPNLPASATLFDHGPPEIARQLTLLDFELFAKIKPLELVNQAWVKPKYSHQAKNILHFAERMNTLTRWTGELLSLKIHFILLHSKVMFSLTFGWNARF